MKKIELTHPRIFDEIERAESYYRRQKTSIQRMGKYLASVLKKDGFTGGRILDVGCGFAAVPIEIAKLIPDVEIIGVDLAEPLLDIGRRDISDAGLKANIRLENGDAQKLEMAEHSFDVVVNTFLMHIVENPVAMLNEIERVARPDARILISDLRRFFMGYFMNKFRMTYTLSEALELISASELREGKASNGLFWWDYHVLKNK